VTSQVIGSTGLTKRFGRILAVDGIDLDVREGDVYGFLGANGSGKTTTVRMLLGLVLATSGTAQVLGETMPRSAGGVLDQVGTLVEGPAAYGHLSGRANLTLFDAMGARNGRRRRRDRVADALAQVGLSAAGDRKVKGYSLGMRQRLGLAAALLRAPRLLVLDEPTNGLDPQGTREVRNLVRSLAADGATVFVSSHLLAEVEQICTHAAIMSAGRLVAQGTLPELRQAGQARIRVLTPDAGTAVQVLAGLGLTVNGDGGRRARVPSVSSAGPGNTGNGSAPEGAVLFAPLPAAGSDGSVQPEVVVAALVAAGVRVRGFGTEQASLEERFVALTGEGFDVVQ
jgi:ABC-2 type transport system ATP-binding protein